MVGGWLVGLRWWSLRLAAVAVVAANSDHRELFGVTTTHLRWPRVAGGGAPPPLEAGGATTGRAVVWDGLSV